VLGLKVFETLLLLNGILTSSDKEWLTYLKITINSVAMQTRFLKNAHILLDEKTIIDKKLYNKLETIIN
jgi:hypothetical protein